jgi:predicted permease
MARVVIVLIALLLVPPCANVAILVYARTVARQREMATRFVLGATRRRIVAQIFVEVLVLALLSGIAAIGVSRLVLWWLQRSLGVDLDSLLPFWMDLRLSPMTVFFVSALAVLAATIAGVVPALRATADPMQHGLRTSGGATMTLGARWTSLVVLQVAFTLAALPSAPELAWGVLRARILGPGFAAETFLTTEVWLDRDAPATQGSTNARLATVHSELLERVAADTDVLGVSEALTAPGQEPWSQVEIEPSPATVDPASPMFGHMTRLNLVDANFLDMFDVPILAGRGFIAADFAPEAAGVLISRSFAERLIGSGNPLGRRFRHLRMLGGATMPPAMAGRWFEIVGIVPDLPANTREATVYHPLIPGSLNPVNIVLRTRSASSGVPYRIRTTAASVHPDLYLEEPWTLEEAYRRAAVGNYLGAGTLAAVTVSVLLLSVAGIYALMSFTVNQRRKEIGIRSALGAGPRRLLSAILQRALGQVGAGAALGLTAAMILDRIVPVVTPDAENIPAAVPAAAAFMVAVAMLAAAGPALRALRLDPIEELRHD